MFSGNSDDNKDNDSSSNKNVAERNTSNIEDKNTKNKNVLQEDENDEFNLSLGELKLGSTRQEVQDVFGTRKNFTGYGGDRYDDIVVKFEENLVHELQSYTDKVQTEQGIKQGDSVQKLLSAYGKEKIVHGVEAE